MQNFDYNSKEICPTRKVRMYKPFWSKELQKLKVEREQARQAAETNKDKESFLDWKNKAARFRKDILNAKRNAFDKFVENLDYKQDSNKVYKYISTVRKESTHKQPIRYGHKNITDDYKIASAFNTYYSAPKLSRQHRKLQKSMKLEIKKKMQVQNQNVTSTDEIFYHNFNLLELETAINKLSNKKAPGPDNIHPEFIKHLGTKARNALLDFYNYVWNTSVPANWKKSNIIPILKPGKTADKIESYRPISLTSHLAKIMERMISE